METQKRKVALVGTGMVGMSYAYALLNQGACEELVLIDINKEKAAGEAMDLNHGLAFAQSNMKIYAGDYDDCRDADMVVISAGVNQKPGESRLDLLNANAKVLRSIVSSVVRSGFLGVFLVASNPVDILTRIVFELSGFDPNRVIGTGTTLDTARLRYLIGKKFGVDPKSVHAYVIGEHGDSEFVPWSQAMISTKPVIDFCMESRCPCSVENLSEIESQVRNSAQKIIAAKRATYYGIGMAMARITKVVLGGENSVLTVSACLDGEYSLHDMFIGTPCIVNSRGVKRVLELNLISDELKQFGESAHMLDRLFREVDLREESMR